MFPSKKTDMIKQKVEEDEDEVKGGVGSSRAMKKSTGKAQSIYTTGLPIT